MVQALRREGASGALRRIVQSWDTTNKATELSDFSVCTTWGVRGKNLYLLGLLRQRLEYPALKRAVREPQNLFNATEVLRPLGQPSTFERLRWLAGASVRT
jgi:phage terminase large subunit-like protein